MQPPNHTPLIALPALVMDLETTGLDITNDRVIQIGAIAMLGECIQEQPQLNQLVNPGIPVPSTSSKIHGLQDEHVSHAPEFGEIAEQISEAIQERVIIGHHIAFDVAVLRHEFARHNLVWQEPVLIDLCMVVGALQPALPDVSLETVSDFLNVDINNRHSALGDTQAAVDAWQKLIPLLGHKGIRTLGELNALISQRQDLLLRQAEAGWLKMPDHIITPTSAFTQRIDSYVFEHTLNDVMSRPCEFIDPGSNLRHAAKRMAGSESRCVFVGTPDATPVGIVTENDLIRVMATQAADIDQYPVDDVMSSPVQIIHQNEMLYRALARMDRLGIGHLCVVDDNHLPLGVVSQRNLLQYRARGPNMLSDALEIATDTQSLAAAYARVTGVAEQLLNEGLDGSEIARVIATEMQVLTERAASIALDTMLSDGESDPPSRWTILVLGSCGRGESLLNADQDNALIYDASVEDDSWFARFGDIMTSILDTAGLPLCQGHVMISNSQWRGSMSTWEQRLQDWLRQARSKDLLNIDIFFDMVAVDGDVIEAQRLFQHAIEAASKTPPFINLLAQSVLSVAPRFGFFNRLPNKEGRIDLKRDGLLPLVSFARTLAISIGSLSRSTPDRLRDLISVGKLAEGDGERLIQLHKRLLTLILRQQLQDVHEGISPGTRVDLSKFSRKEYSRLIQELRHLNIMVGEIQSLVVH